jgi:hypothetical protein
MRFFPRGLWGSFADRFDVAVFPVRRRLVQRLPAIHSEGGLHD